MVPERASRGGTPSCPGCRARPQEDPGPSYSQTCSHQFPADDVSALGSIRKTAHLGISAVLAFVAHPIHDVRIVQGLPCLYDRSLWMVTRVPDSSAGGLIRHNPQASPQAAPRLGPGLKNGEVPGWWRRLGPGYSPFPPSLHPVPSRKRPMEMTRMSRGGDRCSIERWDSTDMARGGHEEGQRPSAGQVGTGERLGHVSTGR